MLFQKQKYHGFDFSALKMTLNIKQKLLVFSFLFILFTFTYDVLGGIFLDLLHSIFESAEYTLDLCIEHVFETRTHETQVIVFYILIAIISYFSFRLYCFLPRCYQGIKCSLAKDKAEIIDYWHALPLLTKCKTSLFILFSLFLWFSLCI